jgi:arginine exporter protein ArgO
MEGGAAVILIVGLVLRIVGAIVCSNKAKELNRNSGGWGMFGFISPIIAMIWIHCLNPIIIWDRNVPLGNSNATAPNNGTIFCAECGKQSSTANSFCMHCGKALLSQE